MVTEMNGYPAGSGRYVELFCLSTDSKPTEGIANGSICTELNAGTGAVTTYFFNEAGGAWVAAT